TIAKVTGSHVMPPWKAEPASYPYRDERRLASKEIELIQTWVKTDMPEGNASEKPEPPKFASGWRLGEPDLVVEMPAAYHVPAVGAQPAFFPEGLALRLPKGSDLVVQYHFHPTGKPETEKSLIGLYFAKKAPERALTRIQLPPHYSLFSGLDIPAGEKDFVIRDSYTLPVATDAVGVSAHAHYLG